MPRFGHRPSYLSLEKIFKQLFLNTHLDLLKNKNKKPSPLRKARVKHCNVARHILAVSVKIQDVA